MISSYRQGVLYALQPALSSTGSWVLCHLQPILPESMNESMNHLLRVAWLFPINRWRNQCEGGSNYLSRSFCSRAGDLTQICLSPEQNWIKRNSSGGKKKNPIQNRKDVAGKLIQSYRVASWETRDEPHHVGLSVSFSNLSKLQREKVLALSGVWLLATPRPDPIRLLCPWIFQARILEWVAIASSRGSSQPRDQTGISCVSWTTGRFFIQARISLNILLAPGGLDSTSHLCHQRPGASWTCERHPTRAAVGRTRHGSFT